MKNSWIRYVIFVLFQPFVPPVGILTTVIHEAAHWVSAIIEGIPISKINVGWYGIGPGVSIPLDTPKESLPLFFYSGGVSSAIIILLLYVFYWTRLYYRTPSATNWIMSMCILISFTIQIYLGILEGIHHQDYPSYLISNQIIVLFICAIALHSLLFFLLGKHKKRYGKDKRFDQF